MSNVVESSKILPPHHIQQELCTTRPLYRQGRNLTAVKVYTINNESQHLLIYKVPKINLSNELKSLCMKYGEIKKLNVALKYKTEIFTECFHVHYERIQSARIAKKFLDNKSFYGEVLHVCYAPELETLNETRNKLLQRQKDVLSRLEPGPTISEYVNMQVENNSQQNRKRKYPAIPITEKRLQNENADLIWAGIPSDIDPRLKKSADPKTGFKKHFQIIENKPRGVEYGPYIPLDPSEITVNVQPKIIRTTLLPTTVIKNYDKDSKKRIVFKNKT